MKMQLWAVLFSLFSTGLLFGGLPRIESMKADESIRVQVTYSEPKITVYLYHFKGREVTISEDRKVDDHKYETGRTRRSWQRSVTSFLDSSFYSAGATAIRQRRYNR